VVPTFKLPKLQEKRGKTNRKLDKRHKHVSSNFRMLTNAITASQKEAPKMVGSLLWD